MKPPDLLVPLVLLAPGAPLASLGLVALLVPPEPLVLPDPPGLRVARAPKAPPAAKAILEPPVVLVLPEQQVPLDPLGPPDLLELKAKRIELLRENMALNLAGRQDEETPTERI